MLAPLRRSKDLETLLVSPPVNHTNIDAQIVLDRARRTRESVRVRIDGNSAKQGSNIRRSHAECEVMVKVVVEVDPHGESSRGRGVPHAEAVGGNGLRSTVKVTHRCTRQNMRADRRLLFAIEAVLRPRHEGVLRDERILEREDIVADLSVSVGSAHVTDNAPLRGEVSSDAGRPGHLIIFLEKLAAAEAQVTAAARYLPLVAIGLFDGACNACLAGGVDAPLTRSLSMKREARQRYSQRNCERQTRP